MVEDTSCVPEKHTQVIEQASLIEDCSKRSQRGKLDIK